MIDINTILTQALTTAVAEATKPLVERIAALEVQLAQVQAAPAPQMEEAVSAYLDNAESFWHRIECFVQTRTADAIDAHLENADHLDEDDVHSLIETAIDNHEENRTHGDNDDIEEMVQKLLNGATLSISV
jgi:AcrR family transcriptional regulator